VEPESDPEQEQQPARQSQPPFFNGFVQQVGRAGTNETRSPWGAGGGLDVETCMPWAGWQRFFRCRRATVWWSRSMV
jgi:hypothetical protein